MIEGLIFKTYSLSALLINQDASFEFFSSRYFSINCARTLSLLQKAHCVGGFLRREAKAEGAGGHFWHDAVTKPNIITPAP